MNRFDPRPSPELRCSYCHGSAVGVDACAECGTLTHPSCRAEAGGCVTLGCADSARVLTVDMIKPSLSGEQRSRLGGWEIELGVVVVIVLGGLAAGAVAKFTSALDQVVSPGAYPIQTSLTDEIR